MCLKSMISGVCITIILLSLGFMAGRSTTVVETYDFSKSIQDTQQKIKPLPIK